MGSIAGDEENGLVNVGIGVDIEVNAAGHVGTHLNDVARDGAFGRGKQQGTEVERHGLPVG